MGSTLLNQVASNSNRLNSNAQSYDATGNFTSNGALQFSYDAAGRLKSAIMPNGITYAYGVNVHGQRVSKTEQTGGTRLFSYDEADTSSANTIPAVRVSKSTFG